MNRCGVTYDVGRVFGLNWRPTFDPAVIRRELEIIRDDLHCNAVRICGRDLPRLTFAAERATELGLAVLLSPELFDKSPEATLAYLAKAAAVAERLRRAAPGQVVLSVGSEATLFMRGIVPGRTLQGRVANLFKAGRSEQQRASLRAFLERAAGTARAAFEGEITYASLTFEDVDWSLFDIVGVDHYREARIKDRYVQMLEPLLGLGKPVLVTEIGMRGYQGAESSGALGFGVADTRSLFLHSLPVVGRFVRPHLQAGEFVRDEELQAREITETLEILGQAGVDGAFVCTFVEQLSPYREEPHYDLDMSALSLVKTYSDRMGTTYPDMSWEPKASFRAVAEFYAHHGC